MLHRIPIYTRKVFVEFLFFFTHHPLSKWLSLWTRRKQKIVTEYLFSDKDSAANIHKRLVNVYGKATINVITVR